MSRKILKILISLLFLAVATVAAVFAIKIFTPKSTPEPAQPNQGVESASQLPAQPGRIRKEAAPSELQHRSAVSLYGVAPIFRPSSANTTRYGVIGISRSQELKLIKLKSDLHKQQETK